MPDGTHRYTDDPWENVDLQTRMEQDNDYVAEKWAELHDMEDD